MHILSFGKQLTLSIFFIQTMVSVVYCSNAQKAYLQNPSNPSLKLAYAQTAPCSTAIRLYNELSKSENVNDSLKAVAFKRLGDYSFTVEEYPKAVEYYRQAAKSSSLPFYRHQWALASMSAGDFDAAQSLWHTLSLEFGDEISQMANYYLGLLQLKKANYESALSFFMKTGKANPEHYWTIASLAGKLECVSRLGMIDKVKLYSEQLRPFHKVLLEKDLIDLSVLEVSGSFTDSSTLKNKQPGSDTAALFTLQVGAFGSTENAANLQKKLSLEFKDVSVVTVKSGEQIFYRVRIGSFKSRDDAQKFAHDSLIKSGLNYTVVEKTIF